MAKAAFNTKKTLFTSKFDLNLRKKSVNFEILIIALYGAETYTRRKIDHKHLENFEMWRWRGMEISGTDHVRNEEVCQRIKEDRKSLQKLKRRKCNWIGHILRRNCLLKRVIEGKIEERI